ncbi:RNA methyltransferase [Candidatus Bathyarchaeota archaeon]|nr:RNA methyltransferase [Candidatus Bathyarchaeota archaeon]
MPKNHRKITIALPVSIISEIPHLREKTLEIGLIARAAAIFRINEIIIFSDDVGINKKRESNLIVTLLSYMETPQYLRKRLFKIKPDLRYVGILPPLRTPHHPLERRARKLIKGEYREGAIVSVNERGSMIDIGVEFPLLIPEKKLPINKRVTIRITTSGKHPRIKQVKRDEIETYWGYNVTSTKWSFGKLIKSRSFDLVIATSKLGSPFSQINNELAEKWNKSGKILVAFGSPSCGLKDILKKEQLNLDEFADFTVNTIPNQGTKTVRTEEALYASLALLNNL